MILAHYCLCISLAEQYTPSMLYKGWSGLEIFWLFDQGNCNLHVPIMVWVENFTSSTNNCGIVLQLVPFVACTWEDLFPVPWSYSSKRALVLCFPPLLPMSPIFSDGGCFFIWGASYQSKIWRPLFLLPSRVSCWICSSYLFTGQCYSSNRGSSLQEVHKFLDLWSWMLIDTWISAYWSKCCTSLSGLHCKYARVHCPFGAEQYIQFLLGHWVWSTVMQLHGKLHLVMRITFSFW